MKKRKGGGLERRLQTPSFLAICVVYPSKWPDLISRTGKCCYSRYRTRLLISYLCLGSILWLINDIARRSPWCLAALLGFSILDFTSMYPPRVVRFLRITPSAIHRSTAYHIMSWLHLLHFPTTHSITLILRNLCS